MQYSSIIKRIFASFILKFLGSLCGFLTIVITARFLGAEGRGEVALFVNLLNLILAFTSTFSSSFSYVVGNLKYQVQKVFNLAILLNLFFLPILLYLFSLFHYKYFMFIILIFLFANVLYYIEGLGYGIDNFRLVNIIRNVPSILTFVFTFLFLNYKQDVSLAIFSNVLGFFIVFLFVFPNFLKFLNFRVNFQLLKIIIRHGVFIALSTLTTFLLYRVDFFLIEKFYSKKELGIYSIAVSIGDINSIILSFIITAVLGKFFSQDGKKVLEQSIVIIWIFQILGIVSFLIFGKLFINLVFTPEFSTAYLPSLILLISTAIYNPSSIIAVYVNVILGKTYIPFIISLISLIFKFFLSLFLIIELSLVGASISCLISYTLTFSIYAFVYFKLIKN
ncbi:MAG: oligosaccharide flippase family protein [candidate division WOR-3 bacterium]